MRSLLESIRKNALEAPFLSLVSKLNDSSASGPDVPPVTCIVSDGFMSFTITAGEDLGIPVIVLYTLSACGFMGFYQFRNLQEKGLTPLKENALEPFLSLVSNLNDTSALDVPPVTCIVSDGFMSFTITAGEGLGIPVVVFFTLSACGFMGFYQFRNLLERGLTPLKGLRKGWRRVMDGGCTSSVCGADMSSQTNIGGISDMEVVLNNGDKPHVVCIPLPAQSHMKAMLKLAKLLHRKGFHITFVNTEYNHQRLLRVRGPNALDGLPRFRFETISDGLPLSDNTKPSQYPVSKNMIPPLLNLLAMLNDTSTAAASLPGVVPPVTCIVSDGFMSFITAEAGEELGIPVVMFFTLSACGFMGFYQFRNLLEKGLTPLKGMILFSKYSSCRTMQICTKLNTRFISAKEKFPQE
ncbi:hypothetical protein RHSIM_Rhsim12G0005300 [Rhododendron simsii]|uniref:Glycosyltransferase N-terminal domain-containing protein n=1 Tax=Rhododendron simsii TaxID=118357 RepID=A0A834L939_RHOSS|nr:hypothetical protein RHSIM_Rhsim12G0005300 [Rhododendron simsii]